jgi:ABC-type transport system involved in cytochrome c biogenesis permease subunit
MLLFGASWGLFLIRRDGVARRLLLAGWIGCVLLFFVNWRLAGGPPFGNMYHVMVLLGLCIPVIYAVLARRADMGWAGAYFAFTAALVLAGAGFMPRDVHWRRMPALQSPWFVPHVFAYMLSYAMMALAFVMTVVKWLRGQSDRHGESARRLIRAGFPFMTFGMLSGALWAEEAWGVYWSWDPKETWSLITWTGYLAFLHATHDPRTARWADTAQVMAFLALLWTFFLVNLAPRLASVLHGYAG